MNQLVFVFPYRGVGGVSLLFLRMAEHLADQAGCNVAIVDYEDGYMAKNLASRCVKLIKYKDSQKVQLPAESSIIFQTMTPWSIFPNLEIHIRSKLFFWNCHPYNLVPHVPLVDQRLKKNRKINKIFLKTILLPYWSQCNRFLKLLVTKRAIAFMDTSNKENSEYFYFPLEVSKYLPVPAAGASVSMKPLKNPKSWKLIRAVWVGRIVEFKYYILLYTLQELEKISSRLNSDILFTIIGDGEYIERLKHEAEKLRKVKVNFISHIETKDLDRYLGDHCDLMFAMGTSALEAAKLGIPTVLLDIFYSEVNGEYQYKFLFDRDGSTLGDVMDVNGYESQGNSYNESLLRIFDTLRSDFEKVSLKTRDYFLKFHDISMVGSELLSRIGQSTCTYGDLKESGVIKKGILYRLKRGFR